MSNRHNSCHIAHPRHTHLLASHKSRDHNSDYEPPNYEDNPDYEDTPSVRTSPSNASRPHQRTHHIVIASQPPATLESVTRCLTRSAICPPRSYHHQTALSPMSAMTYLGLCISIEPTFAAILIFIYIVYSRGTHRHLQIEDSQVEIFSALTLLNSSLHIVLK